MITFTITFVSLLVYNYSATIIIVNSVQHSKCCQHNYDCTVNVIGIQLSPCMFPRFLVLSLPNPVAFFTLQVCLLELEY